MVNAEFFDALEQLEKEKGIPVDYMLDRVGQALITAYKRDNDGMTDNVYVEPNREEKTIRMYVRKTVVRTEDLYEPYEEITLEEAADYKVNPQVGDIIDIDIPTKSFGRIAAQTAKQVIIQGIREAERGISSSTRNWAPKPERSTMRMWPTPCATNWYTAIRTFTATSMPIRPTR